MPPRHVAAAVLVAAIWGVNFVVIEVGLRDLPPLLLAALRFVFVAFPAVFLIRRPKVPWRLVVAFGLFLGVGQFGLLFVGMDLGMPAGLASLVLQCQAIFTIAFAAVVLAERPGARTLAGGTVAFAGIAIVGAGRSAGVPLAGLLLCIAAAASWGAANVVTRVARPPDALAMLVWASLVPPLPLLALSAAFEGPTEMADAITGVGPEGVLSLLYLVVPTTLFGFGVWTSLLRRHPAGVVAPFSLLVPLFGMSAAWIALGERPNATELAGGAVVLAGLALVNAPLPRRWVRTADAAAGSPSAVTGPP